jgi:hypothetical protein
VKPIGPLIHFGQLFKWLATKGADVRETHILTPLGDPTETVAWLKWRGYRAAISSSAFSKPGVFFGRKNQPLLLAQVGDVLVWDGQNVVIEE